MQLQSEHHEIWDFLDEGLIVCSSDGQIISANTAASRLLGLSPKSFKTLSELMEALGPECEALGQLQANDSCVLVIAGSLIEAKLNALNEQSVIIFTNRSEELRWQSQLAEHGHMLSTNTESFLVVAQDGSVRYANSFCEKERGYAAGELIGAKLKDLEIGRDIDGVSSKAYTDEDVKEHLAQCLNKGQAIRYDAWHVRKDGSIFPTDVTLRPYRLSKERVLLLTARDETERYKQLQALIEARAEAESSNKAKSAFMAVTSHELRTPLTTVIGFLELLKLDYGEGHGDLSEYLGLMHRSSTSLLRLIEDILDFTKIEAQTLKLEIRSINMDSFLSQVCQHWEMKFSSSSVDFTFEPVGDISGTMQSDPVRLNQLLDNLIGNAKKFTTDGTVNLRVEREQDDYRFMVIDTGCGIDESHQERIYEPFYQVEDAMTRDADGTGLGLYICRNLANILGGKISILSSNEDGTCFELKVPIRGPR